MTFALSRLLSTATASYGVYALAQPRHLGAVLTSDPKKQASFDALTRTYGVRDLAVGALGVFGKSEKTVQAAMLLRVVMDLSDAAILSREAEDESAGKLVLGVTLGWATLNALALLADRHRARA
jgi:Domain of unknown function (DUF4267)